MEALSNTFNKIPILLFALLYWAYLGYDYYDWFKSPASSLGQKRSEYSSIKQNYETSKSKIDEAKAFYQTLDNSKERILQLTAQLENTKAVLSTEVDISNFVKMVTLEAKKLGIVIRSIKPGTESLKDYYVEVPFNIYFRGAYVQLLVFFDRISKLQQVVRVSDFDFKPSGNVRTRYVELEGSAKIIGYKYLGTKADEIGNNADLKVSSKPSSAKETQ